MHRVAHANRHTSQSAEPLQAATPKSTLCTPTCSRHAREIRIGQQESLDPVARISVAMACDRRISSVPSKTPSVSSGYLTVHNTLNSRYFVTITAMLALAFLRFDHTSHKIVAAPEMKPIAPASNTRVAVVSFNNWIAIAQFVKFPVASCKTSRRLVKRSRSRIVQFFFRSFHVEPRSNPFPDKRRERGKRPKPAFEFCLRVNATTPTRQLLTVSFFLCVDCVLLFFR